MSEAMPTAARVRPSMADVGAVAEVSAQTVSRYFTGGYVAAATRERIESAIEALGYRHNRVARNLRSGRTDTIGFLDIGPINYGNASILIGLGRAARVAGMSLITTQLDVDTTAQDRLGEVRTAVDNFLGFQVDGIIIGTPYDGIERVLDWVGDATPVITLSAAYEGIADAASADSYTAGLVATRHLIELGHRRILHLAGPHTRIEARDRARGYRTALAEAGLSELPLLEGYEWSADAGAVHGATADPDAFTAVFTANDELALGFMSAMAARGAIAPRDYSIVGVDDMPEAAYFSPPLTTVRLDFESLGESAMHSILARLRTGERQPHWTAAAELVVRDSTARATGTVGG